MLHIDTHTQQTNARVKVRVADVHSRVVSKDRGERLHL